MYWANFLHFYQPPNQQEDILEAIVNQSYRRILAGFKNHSEIKATFNINGSLLELLSKKGYQDVIEDLKFLLEKGQIELTGTAMYHAFLPLLPKDEIVRQIKLNDEVSHSLFGDLYKPRGFFSPELAYDFATAKVARDLGFSWTVAAELAFPPGKDGANKPRTDCLYTIKDLPSFKVFFRNKRVSVLILSGIVRSAESLLFELADEFSSCKYVLTVMDGETFGHHRPGLEKFLFEIAADQRLKTVTISELGEYFETSKEIVPRASTWSNEEQDFWLDHEHQVISENPFLLWNDSQNPIHKMQWEFTNWVIEKVGGSKLKTEVREMLDKALSSDQYWWASAKPWWSLEMIEQGAYQFKAVLDAIPGISEAEKQKADNYYRRILDCAFDWQRRGVIRQKHKEAFGTFKQRPLRERAPADWYNLLILEFEDEMKKAAEKREYEKAIKWRDAIIKLREGLDVYDVLHVVDDLRAVRTLPSLKGFWEHELSEFSNFAKSAFTDFDEEEFQKEKAEKLEKLRERQKAIEKGKIEFGEEKKYEI